MKTLLVGCGAGFSGDRLDAGLPVVKTLIARGQPSALILKSCRANSSVCSNGPLRKPGPGI